jgi:hypothetical protein
MFGSDNGPWEDAELESSDSSKSSVFTTIEKPVYDEGARNEQSHDIDESSRYANLAKTRGRKGSESALEPPPPPPLNCIWAWESQTQI